MSASDVPAIGVPEECICKENEFGNEFVLDVEINIHIFYALKYDDSQSEQGDSM